MKATRRVALAAAALTAVGALSGLTLASPATGAATGFATTDTTSYGGSAIVTQTDSSTGDVVVSYSSLTSAAPTVANETTNVDGGSEAAAPDGSTSAQTGYDIGYPDSKLSEAASKASVGSIPTAVATLEKMGVTASEASAFASIDSNPSVTNTSAAAGGEGTNDPSGVNTANSPTNDPDGTGTGGGSGCPGPVGSSTAAVTASPNLTPCPQATSATGTSAITAAASSTPRELTCYTVRQFGNKIHTYGCDRQYLAHKTSNLNWWMVDKWEYSGVSNDSGDIGPHRLSGLAAHVYYGSGNKLYQWRPEATHKTGNCNTQQLSLELFGVGWQENQTYCDGNLGPHYIGSKSSGSKWSGKEPHNGNYEYTGGESSTHSPQGAVAADNFHLHVWSVRSYF